MRAPKSFTTASTSSGRACVGSGGYVFIWGCIGFGVIHRKTEGLSIFKEENSVYLVWHECMDGLPNMTMIRVKRAATFLSS